MIRRSRATLHSVAGNDAPTTLPSQAGGGYLSPIPTWSPEMRSYRSGRPDAVSGQLGDQLDEFRLRPRPGGARAHIANCAERQREFGNVIAARRIDEQHEIAVAGREIYLLDLNAHFLGEIAGSLRALGRVLDRANSLVGPVER